MIGIGAAPADLLADEIPRAVVLPLKSESVQKATLEALDEVLAVELSKLTQIQVVTKGDIDAQLERESMKDVLGCDDSSCASDLAGALNARYLLTGTLRIFAYSLTVTLNLIDVHEGKTRRAQGRSEDNIVFYEDAVKAAVRELFGITQESATETSPASPSMATSKPKSREGGASRMGTGAKSLTELTLDLRAKNLASLESNQSGRSEDSVQEDTYLTRDKETTELETQESTVLETFKWISTLGAVAGVALLILGSTPQGAGNKNFMAPGAVLVGTGTLLWVFDLSDIFE